MSLMIETNFPGGNVFIENINGFDALLTRDMRNTIGDWVYLSFRAIFDEKGEYRFAFTQSGSIASFGPAASYDNGNTWEWLGFDCVSGDRNVFTYTYDGTKSASVIFCMGMQYLPQHLDAFLARHGNDRFLAVSTLVRTRKNREVTLLHIEDTSVTSPRKHLFFTSRNHCCEMMATYALEGILETALGEDELGKAFRERYVIDCVPFVDTDGVIDGDQGKNRSPHDHNRDYNEHPIYPEIAAIQKLVLEKKPFFALDLHCPWIYGPETEETIYFPVMEDPYYADETEKFSRILEKNASPEAPYFAQNNLPFGTKWNTGANYNQGMNCNQWISKAAAPHFAAAIEIPYAKASGIALTAESVRAFGRALAKSILEYDDLDSVQDR